MSELTLVDLVRNGTMNAETAATLASIAAERHSFRVVAMPRFAGKSTVTNAMLHCVPANVPVHRLSGDEAEMDRLKRDAGGGYLVVGEFSRALVPSYIWGPPVRKVFETMRAGYSLSTALHAPSVDEAYASICRTNGVPDEDASRLNYMVYIQRMGDDEDSFWRRIAQVHEVDRVVDGRPQGRLLYRWRERDDRFEQVEEPRLLAVDADRLRERAGGTPYVCPAAGQPRGVSSYAASKPNFQVPAHRAGVIGPEWRGRCTVHRSRLPALTHR